jgi:hypothetical protein
VDVHDLLSRLQKWRDSNPIVRGQKVHLAEVRLRSTGEGRLAVSLYPRHPSEVGAKDAYLELAVRASIAHEQGVEVEHPIPPDFKDRAFACFASLDDLLAMLDGRREAEFFFDDELGEGEDPLVT